MDYKKEREKAKKWAENKRKRNELWEIRHKYDSPLSFSKWAFIFMMINCTIVEIYSMIVMIVLLDLSALPSLITAVIGECIIVVGYYAKAAIENKQGGITYEMTMRENESEG